jgi:hypothetical protein
MYLTYSFIASLAFARKASSTGGPHVRPVSVHDLKGCQRKKIAATIKIRMMAMYTGILGRWIDEARGQDDPVWDEIVSGLMALEDQD